MNCGENCWLTTSLRRLVPAKAFAGRPSQRARRLNVEPENNQTGAKAGVALAPVISLSGVLHQRFLTEFG
jgi:hypothetical protein